MATVLTLASSKNPGADLWIFPEPKNCRHVLQIDRSMNFQILNSLRHRSKARPTEISEIISETELQTPEPQLLNNHPLLIPCQKHLPAKWVLVAPFENLEQWIKSLYQTLSGLNHPSFRVFLPSGQNAGDFQKIWQTYSDQEEYTLVLE